LVCPNANPATPKPATLTDFAVGIGADYAKFGAPARGERVAKYNRLLSIETELAQK